MVGLSLLVCGQFFAQQDPQFTQYFDNILYVNPAYAGSHDGLSISGIHREQWVGFEGRPRSTSFNLHSPLKYESLGLGLSVVADQAGPMRQNMFYGDFSYSLNLKNKRFLSFGVKGGINLINVSSNNLTTTTSNDPKLLSNVSNKVNPNFGAGIYYYTPRFFAGVSIPKFLEQSYDGISATNLERRHYFGIIGGVFDAGPMWKIRPFLQTKFTSGAPISVDVSVAGIYADRLWLGAMYRLDAAIGAFVQFQITPQFKLGIASDFGTQRIRNHNYGTYELMLSYSFNKTVSGVRSPRYF